MPVYVKTHCLLCNKPFEVVDNPLPVAWCSQECRQKDTDEHARLIAALREIGRLARWGKRMERDASPDEIRILAAGDMQSIKRIAEGATGLKFHEYT